MNSKTIMAIQGLLGVTQDGKWGPESQAALDAIVNPVSSDIHSVIASSFADPSDVRAFKLCKSAGGSDEECFKVGDNAIGEWEDSTAEGTGPCCALPPEVIEQQWGSIASGKHKQVIVTHNDLEVVCVLKDLMPHLANITTHARIDLNPDAVRALGMEPPIMEPVVWKWI
jgi:hypothetical protein